MLVLSLRPGEKVLLFDQEAGEHQEVTVSVVGIRGSKVRVAFDAPARVKILREKLARRKTA